MTGFDLFRSGLVVFGGLFSIGGAVFEWSFFMQSRRAQLLVGLIGYQAARVLYVVLGLMLVVLGIALLFL